MFKAFKMLAEVINVYGIFVGIPDGEISPSRHGRSWEVKCKTGFQETGSVDLDYINVAYFVTPCRDLIPSLQHEKLCLFPFFFCSMFCLLTRIIVTWVRTQTQHFTEIIRRDYFHKGF
jgi:hypothetical protein